MVTQYCFSLWHYELCDDDDSEGRDDDDDGDGDVESAGDNDWQVTVVLVVTQFLKEGGTVPPPFNIIPTLKVTNIIVTIILPPDYNLCNKHRWQNHNHHCLTSSYYHCWPLEGWFCDKPTHSCYMIIANDQASTSWIHLMCSLWISRGTRQSLWCSSLSQSPFPDCILPISLLYWENQSRLERSRHVRQGEHHHHHHHHEARRKTVIHGSILQNHIQHKMTLASEKEEQYQTIMQNLVRRYVTEVCHCHCHHHRHCHRHRHRHQRRKWTISGAAQVREPGCHWRRCRRNQERHICFQVPDLREGFTKRGKAWSFTIPPLP